MVNPVVKPQTRGQNYFSIALKGSIVHFCTLNTFRDAMNLHFCKKIVKSLCKIAKNAKIKKINTFCF